PSPFSYVLLRLTPRRHRQLSSAPTWTGRRPGCTECRAGATAEGSRGNMAAIAADRTGGGHGSGVRPSRGSPWQMDSG
ncbi:MAG: hypothetical protein MZV63_24025, partial [Marinilabiliales bacterium]|nr:hypothetical protein [Marinilabiliales bacterium]